MATSLVRSSAVVGVGTLLSRVTGLLRVVALGYALGVTQLADVYNLANTTPNLVYELVLGGVLSATLVPVFLERLDKGDDDAVSAVVTVTTVLMLGLTTIAVLAAPLLLQLYLVLRPDPDAAVTDVGVDLMRFLLPQIVFYGLTTLGTAILNARRRFAAPAFAPILNNLIVCAVLFALPTVADDALSIEEVSASTVAFVGIGTTAGVAAMTLALWPSVRATGLRLRWNPDWRNPAVLAVARLSGWTVGYVVANQVALVVVQALALSRPGTLSEYTYAFIFFQLPHGLVAVSVMTTFLPELSAAATGGDLGRYRARFGYGMRLIVLLVAPAAAAYVALATPLVSTLLEYGAFGTAATDEVARALVAFAPGIVGFSVYLYAVRGFYALRDTRTPFALNLLQNGLNIGLAVTFGALWSRSAAVLAASYSIAYLVAAALALGALRRRVGGLGGRTVGRTASAAVAGGLVAALAAHLVTEALEGLPSVVTLAAGLVTAAASYVVTLGAVAVVGSARQAAGQG